MQSPRCLAAVEHVRAAAGWEGVAAIDLSRPKIFSPHAKLGMGSLRRRSELDLWGIGTFFPNQPQFEPKRHVTTRGQDLA